MTITSSHVHTQIYTLKPLRPVISPESATYSYGSTIPVSITCATPGVTIRYTTDDSEPSESSTEYTVPFDVTASTNVKAKAFKSGWSPSNTAGAVYVITLPAGNWVSYFDNTYWESAGKGTWDGVKWVSEASGDQNIIALAPIGSWELDFRPTKVRVEHTGTNCSFVIFDTNDPDSPIAIDYSYVSGDELTMTFSEFDILGIESNADDPWRITNIEFYE